MPDEPGDPPFVVLMVCTGNIGRSPMMERIMCRELSVRGAPSAVSVVSAGTWGQPGRPMEPGARHALIERGIDAENFSATALSESAISGADLVLVATREHRRDVVHMAPAAVRRTFTLHELARIAESEPVPPLELSESPTGAPLVHMSRAVAWAAQVRGSVARPEHDEDDDLPDPLGDPDEVYRERAASIAASVERIVPYLLGRPPPG